jgi:hypothetical protein
VIQHQPVQEGGLMHVTPRGARCWAGRGMDSSEVVGWIPTRPKEKARCSVGFLIPTG